MIKRTEEKSSDLEDWWIINSLLVLWIQNTIETTLHSTISHVEVVEDLWACIRERFSISNGPRYNMKEDLAECKQKGLAIVDYRGKLMKL